MADDKKVKGMRLDPAYLGERRFRTAVDAAKQVIHDAEACGVNTIYMRAYSPGYGAYYRTTYCQKKAPCLFADPEDTDVLGAVISAARDAGIHVVAWLPVNDFREVWKANSTWRSRAIKKDATGAVVIVDGKAVIVDYMPDGADVGIEEQDAKRHHMLSCSHPGFIDWYTRFLDDLLTNYPELYGIEAGEGEVDINWQNEADVSDEVMKLCPGVDASTAASSEEWRAARALGLTNLHAILAKAAHERGKRAYVVSTWTAAADGSLANPVDIRNGTGFDWEGIMNLTPRELRPDVMIGEFMFQQWRAYHNDAVTFNPDWTTGAVKQFVENVKERTGAQAHVELSKCGGPEVTIDEFQKALAAAFGNARGGADFYDWWQAYERPEGKAFLAVKAVFARLVRPA